MTTHPNNGITSDQEHWRKIFNKKCDTYSVNKFKSHNYIHHIYNAYGNKQSLDKLLRSEPDKWFKALSNEWGRLSRGNIHNVKYTDTVDFISYQEVPPDKKVTYASFVCDHRPFKDE